MSMYDKSYCSTPCDQQDCERNLKHNKPGTKYYSVTTFDDSNPDKSHKTCKWKIKIRKDSIYEILYIRFTFSATKK